MVVKSNIRNKIVSSLAGIIIILSVAGLPTNLFGYNKTFTIFSVAAVTLIIFLLLPIICTWNGKIHKSDILCFCAIALYLIDFRSFDNLWNIGCICLLLLFICLRWCKQISFTIIFKCCLWALFLLNLWGYLQYFKYIPSFSQFFPITGPYHNPAIFAVMLSLLLGIVLNIFLLFYSLLKKNHFLLIIITIISSFSLPLLIMTNARAAYLALLSSVLYCLYTKFAAKKQAYNPLTINSIVIVLILLFIGILYKQKPQSADGRLLIWKISAKMIQNKPFLGYGKGGFTANYMYYQAEYMKSTASISEKRLAGSTHLAFNDLLRITVDHGLIGMLIYIAIIVWILRPPKKKDPISITIKSLLSGIVLWGMFAYPDSTFSILTFSVMSLACYFNRAAGNTCIHINGKLSKIIVMILFVTALFLTERLSAKWQIYHGMHTYLQSYSAKSIARNFNVLNRFKKEMANDIGFAHLYCQMAKIGNKDIEFISTILFLENKFPDPSVWVMKGDYLKKNGELEKAEAAYKLASNMVPTLQTPRGRLAILYNEIGRKKEAIRIVQEILKEETKVYNFDTFRLHRELKRIFKDELD